ncbi:serine hydrolase [Qipengyuania sp. JC766]|uniref:serine hydrolase n=1 Tax=Qipengyuania sp. JC766 TaxID=3232139 RepID=UPI00345949C7
MTIAPDLARKAKLLGLALLIGVPLIALVAVYTQRFIDARHLPVLTVPLGEHAEEVVEEVADRRTPQLQALDDALFDAGSSLDSHLGIAVVDVATGRAADFNGREPMPQQSVSKMWVALAALDLADRGTLNLNEVATVRRQDLTLFHQPIREQVVSQGSFRATYGELMRLAITGSDNTANDMLLRRVGGPKVVRSILAQKDIDGIRFGPGERLMQSGIAALKWDPSFSVGRSFYDARDMVPAAARREAFERYVDDPVDGATALAIARTLARLAKGDLLSPASTERLVGLMRQAKSGPNRLKGGAPSGWTVAHKTGTGQELATSGRKEQAGYNDIAILTAPDGRRYAVAVLIGRTDKPIPERMDMMHRVVAAVVAYHEAMG